MSMITGDPSTPAALPPPRVRAARPRATVLDVARRAGVSGRTVSRVMAGDSNVSDETRERVMEAAHLLKFRPNRLARELRTGGVSTTVGFVVGDPANPFYFQVAAGVERVIGEQGLTMLLAATRDDPEREPRTVGAVLEHRVIALLLVPIGDDHAFLRHERELGTPIVAVDRPAVGVDVDTVVLDNRGGAATGVRWLLAHGHRKVAYVGSAPGTYTHEERLAGYRQALADAGIPPAPERERTDACDVAAAERAVRELLALQDPPTAVFAGHNRATMGVLRALRSIPGPVALVGFDDFDLADVLGVTVVAHDAEEMGAEAARLALSAQEDESRPTRHVVLPTRLIPRGSGEIPMLRQDS